MNALALILVIQAAPQTPVTVEEYIQLKDISDVRASPAADAVAFIVSEVDLEESRSARELFLWRPGTEARQVTGERGDVRSPRWSPDGQWLAFLSRGREENASQVWILPILQGGEAVQLTELDGGAIDYGWASDSSIYVLTRSAQAAVLTALEEREEQEKDDPVVVRDGAERDREFWRVAVPGGEAAYTWGGDKGIADMAVSGDGLSIAYASNATGAVGDYASFDLWVLDVAAETPRRLTSREGGERAPAWSPDGGRVVFRAPQNPELSYSQTELFSVAASGGRPQSLTEAFDRSILRHEWRAGGELVFSAGLGAYTHLFAIKGGAVVPLTTGLYNYGSFDSRPDGVIYAVRESATRAQEVWRVKPPEDVAEALTALNARALGWSLGRQEMIRWTAPDGLAIEGLLVYPADFEEGRKYPLLINPHGGPSSRVRDVLDQFHGYQLLASQGYAVLAPNFRGSTGYGESFSTANRQDLGGGDFTDIMAGVEHVIGLGLADSSRLGIYGGSYGGYMTNWVISQTQRFEAAVSMYGIFNLITDYSNSNIPRWEHDYLGAHYWEDIDRYLDRSPMRYVDQIDTPVLIIHGADDPNTFISNSNEMYRALRDLDRTVEFVKYPREGHGIREPRHRIDLFFRQLRWFDRYLKFGGADRFDFYLVDEWSPGPNGWALRAVSAETRSRFAGMNPQSGSRYLEVVMALKPETSAAGLDIELGTQVSLTGADDAEARPIGTVIDLFGQKTLVAGAPGSISAPAPEGGAPVAMAVSLAFRIAQAGAHMLHVEGFAPVRIWVRPQK